LSPDEERVALLAVILEGQVEPDSDPAKILGFLRDIEPQAAAAQTTMVEAVAELLRDWQQAREELDFVALISALCGWAPDRAQRALVGWTAKSRMG
jgi:hypothetical protein